MARIVSMLQGDLTSVIVDLESAQVPQSFFGGYSTTFEISQLGLQTGSEVESLPLNEGSNIA
jgi:hypothetical protein